MSFISVLGVSGLVTGGIIIGYALHGLLATSKVRSQETEIWSLRRRLEVIRKLTLQDWDNEENSN